MKSKLILVTTAFFLLLQLNFQAATIYTSDGSELENNSEVCAYDDYFYNVQSDGMFEAEIVNSNNNVLLSTVNAVNGELKFTFPLNVPNLIVYVYTYVETEPQLVDKFEFNVNDCGYEPTVDDFSIVVPQTTFTKTDVGLSFVEPTVENYSLYINEVEENDDGKSVEVKFQEGIAEVELTSDIIQIIEEYTGEDGKKVTKYFEINNESDIVIRNLTNLKLSVIAPLDYLDKKILMRVLIGLITLIILYLVNVIMVKKYRAKREYNRKLKEYKAKKREQMIKAQKRQELERLKNIEKVRKAEQDRARRANLEIRK